jgi:hypothetical protein
MSLWSKLIQLDVKMRQALAVYLIIPLFGLAIPVGLFFLGQSYLAYLALADRGVQALATIQSVSETGGRSNRNAVTATFRAGDGRDYTSKALYAIEGSRHLRPGMRIGVLYQSDLPSNNAPSLAYAKGELRNIGFFVVLAGVFFPLLAWIYRERYRALLGRMRGVQYA